MMMRALFFSSSSSSPFLLLFSFILKEAAQRNVSLRDAALDVSLQTRLAKLVTARESIRGRRRRRGR